MNKNLFNYLKKKFNLPDCILFFDISKDENFLKKIKNLFHFYDKILIKTLKSEVEIFNLNRILDYFPYVVLNSTESDEKIERKIKNLIGENLKNNGEKKILLVQNFIKPVMFGFIYADVKNDEFISLVKFDKKSNFEFFIEKNKNSYFSSKFVELTAGNTLRRVFFKLYDESFFNNKVVLEFVCDEKKFYIVDLCVVGNVKFPEINVVFENEENYLFDKKDFDEKFFNEISEKIGINKKIKFKIKKNIFVDYRKLKELDDEIKKKSENDTLIETFYNFCLKFFSDEIKKSISQKNTFSLFNMKMAIVNFFYTRILNFSTYKSLYSNGSLKDSILKLASFRNNMDRYYQIIITSLKSREVPKNLVKETEIEREYYDFDTGKTTFPLKGIIFSRGTVTGKIKIIKKEDDIKKISCNDIVVSEYFDQTKAKAVLKAKGVITAKGGFFSYAAEFSRKLKKPCVGGIFGCEKIFRNGEKVKILNNKIYKI